MSYVDAFLDKKNDTVRIAERVNGQRILRDVPTSYVFYYEDASGTHRSIFGHSCKRAGHRNRHKFYALLNEKRDAGRRIFEPDIKPVFRALVDHYSGADAPALHLGFFDIEVSFDPTRGFAKPNDPFNPITAISLYRSADRKLLTYLLPPATLTWEQAQAIVGGFEDTYLFATERALLEAFLADIEDVDCLTGWNSNAYDIPYLVNRIKQIISIEATKRLCLWGEAPSVRQYKNKFGMMVDSYDLHGRVHLDYLDLYAKHNQQQRQSYRLDAIGEIEVGETKVPYEGTLEDLYQKDFPKFIAYNRQDVMIMVKIDRKRKFIELANQIAHANSVLLQTTMGSVALVEQAIINEMHAMGLVVPEHKQDEAPEGDVAEHDYVGDDEDEGHAPVVGAYVAKPKTGLHDHVGCVDINSLYPSAIRALNMSPETLVGQLRPIETSALIQQRIDEGIKRAEAWDGLFCTREVQHIHDRDATVITVDFFDHLTDGITTSEMTGRELYEHIFDPANHLCITANGTIFSTATEGIIPALLAKWYAERKEMQKKQKEWEDKLKLAESEEDKAEAAGWVDFWNQRQQARKILLNSLYGALLNEALRFYDERLGQSTTLTGRSIVRHMNATINEIITGKYDHQGDAIVYADTDSCYFSAYTVLKDDPTYAKFDWSRENIIELYDLIADQANDTFPAFMAKTFNTSLERGSIIRAGRELVASRGLFIKKKKYAVLMYDKEGARLDVDGEPGKLKPMGLDLKRSDTPKVMQQFLEQLLMNLLTGVPQEQMFDDIREFRKTFKTRPGWEKGTPTKVANLAAFAAKINQANKKGLSLDTVQHDEKLRITLPWHVRPSLNWNELCELHGDRYAMRITDSSRIIVCKLRRTPLGMTSVAYPVDEPHLPQWFRDLPFDDEAMEETIIDNKIKNLVGVLEWDLTDTKIRSGDSLFSWT